jgi:hypothetical protein
LCEGMRLEHGRVGVVIGGDVACCVWWWLCDGFVVRLSENFLGVEMAGALKHLTSLTSLEYVCTGCVGSVSCWCL